METTVTATVGDTAALAATLLELSLRMQALATHGEDLATYGPSKPEAEEGLDEELVGGTITGEPMIKGPNYTPDPTGRRTGEAPIQQTAEGTSHSARAPVTLDLRFALDKSCSSTAASVCLSVCLCNCISVFLPLLCRAEVPTPIRSLRG